MNQRKKEKRIENGPWHKCEIVQLEPEATSQRTLMNEIEQSEHEVYFGLVPLSFPPLPKNAQMKSSVQSPICSNKSEIHFKNKNGTGNNYG